MAMDYVQESSKRVFLKDIAYHIIPPSHSPHATAPSLQHLFGSHELRNPTLLPASLLNAFDIIFLIRKPSASIPSLWRCFIPPLSEKTEDRTLDPAEVGYRETRLLFDYLYPPSARPSDSAFGADPKNKAWEARPLLIDADDLLSCPEDIVQSVCTRVNLPYSASMLSWPTKEDHAYAESLFKKYAGYHEDALNSTGLRLRTSNRNKQGESAPKREDEDEEWTERYGEEAAEMIRSVVEQCQEDYEYLRQFRIKPKTTKDTEDGRGFDSTDNFGINTRGEKSRKTS